MGEVKHVECDAYNESISESINGGVSSCDNVKDFLEACGHKFRESGKAEINLDSFTIVHYNNSGSVRKYILKIVLVFSRLREVNIPTTDDFLIHCILDSLQLEHEQLNILPLETSGV